MKIDFTYWDLGGGQCPLHLPKFGKMQPEMSRCNNCKYNEGGLGIALIEERFHDGRSFEIKLCHAWLLKARDELTKDQGAGI
jgi:hypothetical protein